MSRLALLLALFCLGNAFAETDRLFVHCQPKALELKVRIKAEFWKKEIEDRWCRGKRSGRYPVVVSCSPGTAGNSHLTTFTFDTPLLVNQAKVDIDPSVETVWDKGLPHGLAHAVLPSCFPGQVPVLDVPAWILEGLAQSMYRGIWDDYQIAFGKRDTVPLQKLEDLFFTESRDLTFLTQSGLLIKYLTEELNGPSAFITFVADLGFDQAPKKSIEALGHYVRGFKKTYQLTVSELEEGFRKYVKRESERRLSSEPR